MSYAEKINQLHIKIPKSNPVVANYVAFKSVGNLLYISGQTCRENGVMKYTGKLGLECDIQTGIKASQLCGLNILSQVSSALNGDFDRIISCVSLTVFVQSADNFYDQAQVANGVSDLMTDIFGDAGKATRAAVGVNTLPSNSAVEVTAIFEIKP